MLMNALARRVRAALARGEEGQMAMAMVILILGVFVLFGLAFDTGKWYLDHRLAQQQVEAAALAGALQLPSGDIDGAVDQALTDNGAQVSDRTTAKCDPPDSDSVKVCIRRPSGGVFTALSGIKFAWVSASATAKRFAQPVPFSLMAMDPSACSTLNLTGNGTVSVQGIGSSAGTYTRSSCATGLDLSGNQSILKATGSNDTVSGTASSKCLSGQCTPLPTPQDVLDDPFASVPVPPLSGPCVAINVKNNQTQTLNPGCYSSLTINGTVYLNPGVYILTGGLNMSGNSAVLSADANQNGKLDSNEQVMFYVTCASGGLPAACNGANPAQFSTSGQASFQLQGIPGKPRYQNIAIFVDRTAGSANAVGISGQGSSTLSGAVYAINSGVDITGNGGTLNLNIAVVANSLTFSGNGNVNITYDVSLIPPEYKLALTE